MDYTKERLLEINDELIRRKSRERFSYFVDNVLNLNNDGTKKWDIQPFQFQVMNTVQDYPETLIELPRGHGKTELITLSYPIWKMIVNPNIKILLRSESVDLAANYLEAIKDILENNNMLKKLFGGDEETFISPKGSWSSEEIVIRQRTAIGLKDPTIAIAGLNKSKTGGHYNLIIDDDLVTDKNADSKTMMDQVIDFYRKTVPLQDVTDFQHVTIGTRYSYTDLYNYIEKHSEGVKIIKMRAVKGSIDSGDILFPKLFTKEKLRKIRADMGPYLFSCQYLNNPVDDETATFLHSWIEKMFQYKLGSYSNGWYKNLPRPLNIFILVDPAISQEERADFTSILVAGIDKKNHIYILRIVRDKMTLSEMIDLLFILYEQYNPVTVGVETGAFQKVIQYEIEKEMMTRQIPLPLQGYAFKTKKEVRIRALQPMFERGEIHCDPELENADNLEYELEKFPKGEHDDVIDTLASLIRPEIGFAPVDDYQPTINEIEDPTARYYKAMLDEMDFVGDIEETQTEYLIQKNSQIEQLL